MYPDDFEEAFSRFLDSADYDAGEEALFTLIRAAFLAGFRAGRKWIVLSDGEETQ